MRLGTLTRKAPPAAPVTPSATPAVVDDGRPPSVSPALWRAVPENLREDAVKSAARGLKRSVHPETSIKAFLAKKGLSATPPPPPPPPKVESAPAPSAAPRRLGGFKRRLGGASGSAPSTPLGIAIHRAMRLPDPPGDVAMEAERAILAAIKKDPVMACCDPSSLGSMGVRVPREVLEAVSDMIRSEGDKMVEHFRSRKAAGDPAFSDWDDPDGWSFNLGDNGEDCVPAPSI